MTDRPDVTRLTKEKALGILSRAGLSGDDARTSLSHAMVGFDSIDDMLREAQSMDSTTIWKRFGQDGGRAVVILKGSKDGLCCRIDELEAQVEALRSAQRLWRERRTELEAALRGFVEFCETLAAEEGSPIFALYEQARAVLAGDGGGA